MVLRFPKRAIFCILALSAVGMAFQLRLAAAQARAQASAIDATKAKQYFSEARAICEHEGGRLWGKSLCGPMLFADPDTRSVVANQPDAKSVLKPWDGIFAGTLPEDVEMANTAVTWAGVHWTMVMWPLPDAPTVRARLMMHELFHRIQDDLDLPASNPVNAHLGTLEGRIWLRLEWRALRQALAHPEAPPSERKRAVKDALLFRLRRQSLFPNTAKEERELELNEGLAEYTGYKLRGTDDAATVESLIGRFSSEESQPNFSRSFAYMSGPAYGLLLDLSGKPWRKGLTTASDFGDLLRNAYDVTLPSDIAAAAEQRAALYDGVALRWTETQQAEEREALLAGYKKHLVTGPVLVLPVMGHFNFGFDPNGVIPLDDSSSVYPTLRANDDWGILEVKDGALVVRGQNGFLRVVVEAPRDPLGKSGEITGNGWKLSLAQGWVLVPGKRPGDLVVAKKE